MDQGELTAGAVAHGRARRRFSVALLASSSALAILAAAPVEAAGPGITITTNQASVTNPAGNTTAFVLINGPTIAGAVSNAGTITPGPGTSAGLAVKNASIGGGIINTGTIKSPGVNILVAGSTISGGITNRGAIIGGSGSYGIGISQSTIIGGITNSGTIIFTNAETTAIGGFLLPPGPPNFSTVIGSFVNSGTIIVSTPSVVKTPPGYGGAMPLFAIGFGVTGGITNTGLIAASAAGGVAVVAGIVQDPGATAILIDTGPAPATGPIVNAGTITAVNTGVPGLPGAGATGIRVGGIFGIGNATIAGGITNTGTITVSAPRGSATDIILFAHSISGAVSNSGLIVATGGGFNGVGIEVVDLSAGATIAGGIINTGTIEGNTVAIHLASAAEFGAPANFQGNPTTINQVGGALIGSVTGFSNTNGDVLNFSGGRIVLSPTQTVSGFSTFTQTGGTLMLGVASSSSFATVNVGSATLGGALQLVPTGNLAALAGAPVVLKDIVVSGTPIAGSFASVTTPIGLFQASVSPDGPDALDATLSLSNTALEASAQVLTQSLRFGLERDRMVVDTIENRILVGRSEQGPGLQFASVRGDRLAMSDADEQAQVPAGGSGEGFAMWGRAYGTVGGAPATGTLPGFGEDRIGGLVGADWRLDQFVVGGGFHYAHTTAPFDDGSKSKLDNYEGLVYGGWRGGPAYVTALASGGANDFSISRNLMPFGLTGFATSAPTGSLFSAFGEAGYAFAVGEGAWLTPYVNLDYIHQHVDAFTEAGSLGAFGVAPANGQSLSTTLGLRVSTGIDLGSHGTLVPEVRAGWVHEFLDASQTLTAQLVGTAASPFTVVGTSFGRDSAVVGVGVSHEFAPGASFFLDYDGQFTGGFNQNSGSVGIKVRF